MTGLAFTDLGEGSAEAALLDPAKASGGPLGCAAPINAGAQHAVLIAAAAHLENWVRKSTPPRSFPRIRTTGSGAAATIVRDTHGIATGGIRTPIVDVPVATNDGETQTGNFICSLLGHTKPFDAATIAALYPKGHDQYVNAFDAAVDKAVKAGVWLKPEAGHFKAAAGQVTS
jgi:hypothetical protein